MRRQVDAALLKALQGPLQVMDPDSVATFDRDMPGLSGARRDESGKGIPEAFSFMRRRRRGVTAICSEKGSEAALAWGHLEL
jgi:hypothetical protein